MILRFAAATAVASTLIALASGGLRLSSFPDMENRYLLAGIWCVIPFVWGLWAMLTPKSWMPDRLPLWGAILGLIAGVSALFVLDIPARLTGQPLPTWLRGLGLLLAVAIYYLLWLLVRQTYRALSAPSCSA